MKVGSHRSPSTRGRRRPTCVTDDVTGYVRRDLAMTGKQVLIDDWRREWVRTHDLCMTLK